MGSAPTAFISGWPSAAPGPLALTVIPILMSARAACSAIREADKAKAASIPWRIRILFLPLTFIQPASIGSAAKAEIAFDEPRTVGDFSRSARRRHPAQL